MKIAEIEVVPVVVPDAVPGWLDEAYAVLAIVRSDDGLEGVGLAGTARPLFFKTLAAGICELADLVRGAPVHEPERLHSLIVPPDSFFGPGGVLPMAASVIDTAVWDLIAKSANQPLWRLLGGMSDRIRTYDSYSLLPGATLDELQHAAARSLASGHRAIKLRLGTASGDRVADIVARVRAVREAIGPDIDLMLDVNQAWTPVHSVRVIRHLEPLDLTWIEDPTRMSDVDGQATITAATPVPICAGEYHSGEAPLLDLLKARAVDILMVDLMHVGGVTPFRRIAAAAALFATPIVSHLVPEIFCHLLAAIPNGYMVEDMPWSARLFEQTPPMTEGHIHLPATPGLGLTPDRTFLKTHRAW